MKYLSLTLSLCMLVFMASKAHAFLVPDVAITETQTLSYHCHDNKTMKVRYFTGHNGQSFALLAPANKPLLFVQTLAASGVKYQADHFIWWTKGPHGDLYDMEHGENALPIKSCYLAT